MDEHETNGARLMRWLRNFYDKHSIFFILGGALTFVFVMFSFVMPWTTQPRMTPEGKPVNPWQVEGLKEGNAPIVWVDPQTRCQYLISYGFSFSMVPRMSEDGHTQLCNKPELERH
jgi:hypothetical protein